MSHAHHFTEQVTQRITQHITLHTCILQITRLITAQVTQRITQHITLHTYILQITRHITVHITNNVITLHISYYKSRNLSHYLLHYLSRIGILHRIEDSTMCSLLVKFHGQRYCTS